MAAWASMPRRIQLRTLSRVTEMMVGPPGEPVTKLSLPSRRSIVGVMELSGRWPGAMALASDCISRSEEHTSELQSRLHLVCRLLLEKKKTHEHMYRTSPNTLAFLFYRPFTLDPGCQGANAPSNPAGVGSVGLVRCATLT